MGDTIDADQIAWISANDSYDLGLHNGKIICKNAKGRVLASVPKAARDSDAGQQLAALKEWLGEHSQQCSETIDTWMLRSLPVQAAVLHAVWPDPTWRGILENAVVCEFADGEADQDAGGFLKDIRDDGVGVITLDGESEWLTAAELLIPHPILLEDIDDYRELATELDFQQGVQQLYREVHTIPEDVGDASAVSDYSNGKFEALSHVLSLCRRLGYRVSGGYAIATIWEDGKSLEARYWIGADNPEYETWTENLIFTDANERTVPLSAVGPVAYSEGVRMAAAIYAKRVVEKEEEND